MFDIVANVSESKSDIVLEEIAGLRNGFDIPSKMVGAGVNLTEFESANGKTAFDFYRQQHGVVKVRGRTLRQSLTKVIKSSWYQNIDARSYPNFKSKRISELQKIIRRHRAKALDATLNEFPPLRTAYDMSVGIRSSQRRGVDVYEQVENLINSQQ
jgi:hypothetical protein